MLWNDLFISGTGQFLPSRVPITQATMIERNDAAEPHLSDYVSFTESATVTAPEMATRAANTALARSGHAPGDVAVLTYVQFDEADHFAPVCHVQRVLGIPEDAVAFELSAASDGGTKGLAVAAGLLAAHPDARAAVVAAAGRFRPPRWPDRRFLGLVMADGAASVVLSRSHGRARLIATAHNAIPALETLAAALHGSDNAQQVPLMRTGFGPYVGALRRGVSDVIEQVLQEAGAKATEIARFAVTGLGLAQLSTIVLEPFAITIDRTTWPLLRELGHVGPCDALIGLDHLLDEGDVHPGDLILLLGTGLGFRCTAILLEVQGSSDNC